MAPVKFGLFKTRSRDYQEQPSTENLLQSSHEQILTPNSPVPSTSKGHQENLAVAEMSILNLDSEDDEISEGVEVVRRGSQGSGAEETSLNYQELRNESDDTSISTIQADNVDRIENNDDVENSTMAMDEDGASTSCDANSLQFDEMSLAPSEDLSVHCGGLKKKKFFATVPREGSLQKDKSKEERRRRLMRDFDMWQASNVEVMQNLLSKSGTQDEQMKWEAIAAARGLCTLTASCACRDCKGMASAGAAVADGDGGIGAAPFFSFLFF